MPGFSIMQIKNFQMSKLGLEKEVEPEIKLPTFAGWITKKAREFQKNIYFCFTDYATAFDWITINCGQLLERYEYQIILPVA